MPKPKLIAALILISFSLSCVWPGPLPSTAQAEEVAAPPRIEMVYPNYKVVDDPNKQVTIVGSNLGNNDENFKLLLESTTGAVSGNATITTHSDNRIVFIIPDNLAAGNYRVEIITSGGSASTMLFVVGDEGDLNKPSITSITPNTGSVLGGTKVTIKGNSFLVGLTATGQPKLPVVMFGNKEATEVQWISTSELIATAPESENREKQSVPVKVINPDGKASNENLQFEYISEGERIRILNITPDRGTMAGETPVTVRGINFPAAIKGYPTKVEDPGDNIAESMTILIGDVPIRIIEIGIDGYTDENGVFQPHLDENGNIIYLINGVTNSSSKVGPQNVEVFVTWGANKNNRTETDILPNGFTYFYPRTFPKITKVTNTVTKTNVGPINGGHTIEIEGTGFVAPVEVYFGDNKAKVLGMSGDRLITVQLPANDFAGPVNVRVVNTTDGEPTGEDVLVGGFTYRGTSMKISAVTPNYATTAEKKRLTITGENFNEDTLENTLVYFEYRELNPDIPDPDPNNPDHWVIRRESLKDVQFDKNVGIIITALTPDHPASGLKDLVVQNSYGRVRLRDAFTFLPPDIQPKIETVTAAVYQGDIAPSPMGPTVGGTPFIIRGDNFVSGSKVYIGDKLASDIDVRNFNEIYAVSPPGEPGWHSVTVESITGKKDTMPAWDGKEPEPPEGKKGFYYYSNPKITNISPSRGSVDGGNIITITGEQFYPGYEVTFGYEHKNSDGSVEFISVTEQVYETRLIDNNKIQLRLPALKPEALPEDWAEKLEKDGEVNVYVQVKNKDGRSTVWSRLFLFKKPDKENEIKIHDVSPKMSPIDGGVRVTITGENFHPDARVHFGWEEAEIVSIRSDRIVVLTPPNPVGEYVVTVSNYADTGTAIWEPFRYQDPASAPKIEAVVPNMGPLSGGTKITIIGEYFWPGAKVWIGGKAATDVKADYNYITAVVPPGDRVGPADIIVANPDGGMDLLAGGFSYKSPDSEPSLLSVEPNQVPTTGGTIVTIKGQDFRQGVKVFFGHQEAEIVLFEEPNTIAVVAPPSPTGDEMVVDVTVLNRDGGVAQSVGDKQRIHYILPKSEPFIDRITPTRGPAAGGTRVIIEGDGFSSKGVTVHFGGREAEIVGSIQYNRLEVITPPGELGKTVHVTVTNTGEVLGSYTLKNAYTYDASKPTIISVVPNQATYLGGTTVTIRGTGFTTVGAAVYIGEWEGLDVKVIDSETITFITKRIAERPEDLIELKWWDVKVINADGVEAIKKEAFRYLFPDSEPRIISIEPTKGSTEGGMPLTIIGTDFRQRAKVVIGGKEAEILSIDDSPGEGKAKIIVRTPPHEAGEVDVTVINYEGAISNSVKFTYVTPLSFPEITSIDPKQGPTLGSTEVIINGIGFKVDEDTKAPPRVWFGMNEAPSVEFVDYKTLKVVTPPGNEGYVDVLVLNPDMGQAIMSKAFRYIKVKEFVIDKVEPNEGTAEGGTAITITGGPFDQGATVTVGGNPATDVVVVNSNTITAVTPPGEVGWQEVRVINPDGGWAALPAGFFYIKPRTAPEHPPTWVETERKDRETIEIKWDPVEFANYYEIWVSNTRNGRYRFLAQTDRTVYYATGLDYNTTYYFQVRAVNELGVSDFSYYESARTGSGRQQETNLVPENIIMETANGNATATIATANALAYTGYRIDFTQAAYRNAARKAVRISQKALTQAYLPITIEAPGISLSVPGNSIFLGLLTGEEDYAEIIIADLGQQVAERAMRELPRGSRIISPVYEVGWQILKGTASTPQNTFHGQVQLTMNYDVSITPGKQVSLYTYNSTTGKWVNTGAANNTNAPQLTLGITNGGRFMLVEH